MADLIDIAEVIDAAYEGEASRPARSYIGASAVGHPCDANLALNLRGYPNNDIPPRVLRIFRDGHRIEDEVVADLKKAGVNVDEVDPDTGEQWTFETLKHVVGHADGIIHLGSKVLLEIKSMNRAKFRDFVNKGIRYSHNQYFAQVQLMMGLGQIERALFVCYCKDDSAYAHEYVEYDMFEFSNLIRRCEIALHNEARRISSDRSYYRCKWCNKSEACWGLREVEKDCTSCSYAIANTVDGGWYCTLRDTPATEVCDHYKLYMPRESDTPW